MACRSKGTSRREAGSAIGKNHCVHRVTLENFFVAENSKMVHLKNFLWNILRNTMLDVKKQQTQHIVFFGYERKTNTTSMLRP